MPTSYPRTPFSHEQMITVYKVLIMDIFLTQTHRFHSKCIPGAMWSTFL